MKKLFILVLSVVAFVAFSGLSAAHPERGAAQ